MSTEIANINITHSNNAYGSD